MSGRDASPRLRALVLAAGLGTRLRPLTLDRPKPLLPVLGRPLVAYTLDRLAELPCELAAVNLHHLGELVPAALGPEHRGMPLIYSREPQILGTLGALAPLAELLRPAEAVVLLNGDSLCDWPLAELIADHRASGAAATLLLSETADPREFGGGVGLAADGRIVSFRSAGIESGPPARRLVFAGAHALSPALLERVPARPADIVRELYEPMLAEGAVIRGVTTARAWHDLGTPRRYLEAVLARLAASGGRSRVAAGAAVAASARLEASVVEDGARVEEGAVLERALVLPGARVGAGATVSGSIVGFGAEVPPGATVAAELFSGHGAASERRPLS